MENGTRWYMSKTNWAIFVMTLRTVILMVAPDSTAGQWIDDNKNGIDLVIANILLLCRNVFTKTPTTA